MKRSIGRWTAAVGGLLLAWGMIACAPEEIGFGVDDLPDGDAARGAEVFATSVDGAPKCAGCHALDGGKSSGPALQDYAGEARDRVQGQDAAAYTFYSIVRPAKHVVRGYSNVMYADYADKLSQQQIADLIAYLLTLD